MNEKTRKVFKALLAVLAYALTVLLLTGSAKADISSGLVAYYPFIGNAVDETGNGHDGTVYGATLTTDKDGNSNSAYFFDGVNNYISLSSPSDFKFANNFTICAWIKANPQSTNTIIGVSRDGNYNEYSGYALVITQNSYLYLITHTGSTSSQIIFSQNISNILFSSWVFVCAVKSSEDGMLIYVNGALNNYNSSLTSNVYYDATNYAYIGAEDNDGSLIGNFNGSIDEVRIYNRILNSSEIEELYKTSSLKTKVINNYETQNVTIEYYLTYDNSSFESLRDVKILYNNASSFQNMTYVNSTVNGSEVTETYTWTSSQELPFVNNTNTRVNYSIKYSLINKTDSTTLYFTENYSFFIEYGFKPVSVDLEEDVVENKNSTYYVNALVVSPKYQVRVVLEKDNGTKTNYTPSLHSIQDTNRVYKATILTDNVSLSQYVTETFKPYLIVRDDNGVNYTRTLTPKTQRIHNFSIALTTSTCPSGNNYANYFEALNVNISLEENPQNTIATSSVVENHFYLTPTSGSEFYFSPSINTSTNSYKVCIYPDFTNVTVSDWSDIYYYSNLNNSDETFKRYYWFSPSCTKLSNDAVKNVQLYSFGDADLPYPDDYLTVSIQVKDSQGSAVQDAIVKVLKRFPDGTYKTVEVTKTNTDGTAVAKVVAYRALYKFIVEKDCEALFESQPLQISQSTLTITLPTGTATNPFFDYYQFLLTLYFNLNYTDTEWKLTFTDTSNVVKTHCLQVFEKSFPSWVKKNEQCVTSTAGTITLSRDSSKTQQAVYTVNGIPIALLTSEEANPARQTFKNVGGGFIPIILTMLAMGVSMMIASPSAFFFIEPLILLISHKLGWIAATSATLYGFAILLVVIGVLLSVKKT